MLEKFTDLFSTFSDKASLPKYSVAAVSTGWVAMALTLFFGTDISGDQVQQFFSEADNKEFIRYGLIFAAASWMHSTRVKKEIKNSFSSLTSAINNAVSSMEKRFDDHSLKIELLSSRVLKLENPNLDVQGAYNEQGTSEVRTADRI